MTDQVNKDETADTQTHLEVEQENYIPVSRFALIAALAKYEKDHGYDSQVSNFFPTLEVWRHQQYREKTAKLKESYLQFSPDRDTVSYLKHTEEELDAKLDTLVDITENILEQANYNKISPEDLNKILSEASSYGLSLSVDLDEFEEIMLYYRGAAIDHKTFRTYKSLWLKIERNHFRLYKRLFLLFKLKPEAERMAELIANNNWSEKKAKRVIKKTRASMPKNDDGSFVYMKLFKNIPEDDLEMMFPNTQVKFKLFDKIKLAITAGGGTLASLAGAVGKLALATTNPVAFLTAMVGVGAVIFRHIKNFFMTRDKYQLQLAERLYFHALADNRGALILLADRGEEEDIKEDMLLYFFLFYHPVTYENIDKLDKKIEEYLVSEFKIDCDFDINDALGRLAKDELIYQDETGLLGVVPPMQAQQLLDQKWDIKMRSIQQSNV